MRNQPDVSIKMVLRVEKQLWRAQKVADSRDSSVACSLVRLQEAWKTVVECREKGAEIAMEKSEGGGKRMGNR